MDEPARPGTSAASRIAACLEPADVPRLDYNLAAADARFHVDVDHEGGAWVPAAAVRMPFHHASRIEWTDADAHPELAAVDRRLRFTLTILEVEIEADPGREEWFATYRARIDAVCDPNN